MLTSVARKPITLQDLRNFAITRSLFPPTTLKKALERMQFVQADPIRLPARAQDLTLRHRVKGYRAGDLEKQYEKLGVEEDIFIIYGFMTRKLRALMHPRSMGGVTEREILLAGELARFVAARGAVHPREAHQHFARGKVTNYWGGQSSATTHLLQDMHYRGMVRVLRRESGIRIYAADEHGPGATDASEVRARLDALVDVAVRIYAPLTAKGLGHLVQRMRWAVPQWAGERKTALKRAKERLSQERVGGVDWYWPADEKPDGDVPEMVRLLAPFDPVVWDRGRFGLFWNWDYRFEAYTPEPKRKLGYYALPMLWRDQVIGWANLALESGRLKSEFGYAMPKPREAAFRRELDAEMERMRVFLQV